MPPFNVVLDLALWMGVSIAFTLGLWLLARRLLARDALHEGDTPSCHATGYRSATRDLAAAVAFRIAALYSVIMALVFAQLVGEFREVRDRLAQEAAAVESVRQAGLALGPAGTPIAAAAADYARAVVNREWALLGSDRRLAPEAGAALARAREAALALPGATPRAASLRASALEDLRAIARARQLRLETAAASFSWLFWIPALAGYALVVIPFFVYPPSPANRAMVAALGAFTGVIFFAIQGFGSPYREPVSMAPRAFERLVAGL